MGKNLSPSSQDVKRHRLAKLLAEFRKGRKRLCEIVMEIHRDQLYEGTWEEFCAKELQASRQKGYDLLQAAVVSTNVGATVSQGHARALAPLDPELQKQVHELAQSTGPVTAERLKGLAERAQRFTVSEIRQEEEQLRQRRQASAGPRKSTAALSIDAARKHADGIRKHVEAWRKQARHAQDVADDVETELDKIGPILDRAIELHEGTGELRRAA